MDDVSSSSPGVLRASRRGWRTVLFGVSVVIMLGISGVLLHLLFRQAQRLTKIEVVQKTAFSREVLSPLQMSFSALSARTDALDKRTQSLAQAVATLKTRSQGAPDLSKEVGTLRQAQLALNLQVTGLQARILTSGASPPAVRAGSEIHSSFTARKPRPVARQSAPFVLTGIERRGTEMLAVVVTPGVARLSQVQLLAPGESFMGWELVAVNPHQVTFQMGHRQLLLRGRQ